MFLLFRTYQKYSASVEDLPIPAMGISQLVSHIVSNMTEHDGTTYQLITKAPLRLLGLTSAQNSGVTEALAPRARLQNESTQRQHVY
jgi:hypothetical protein